MLREWMERVRARRRERLAHDYGSLTAVERLELERDRDELGASRARGVEVTYGREFDQQLDAEEGRPRH